jgi:hypothetical protein
MGLVKHHGFVVRDDTAEIVFLDGEVGEEQMVVDDDDVAGNGAALHFCDEAAIELRALLASAELTAGVHF